MISKTTLNSVFLLKAYRGQETWHIIFHWAVIRVSQRCASLQGVPCDLVTGEERTFVDADGRQSGHVACTIEMCSVTTPCKYSCL